MIAWKFKLWRTAGAVAALGLAACGGEGGENGARANGGETGHAEMSGEAGEAAAPAAPAEVSESAAASNGESGEGGASNAYAGLQGDQLKALRIQHLRGFVMAAERMVPDRDGGSVQEASILVQQGLLEVYEGATDQFGALDITPLREAAGGATFTRAQMQQRLRASENALDAAIAPLHADAADLTARLVDVATGLYQQGVDDPTEYKHSMGAALAARNTLVLNQDALRQRSLLAYSRSLAEVERFVALYADGPARPATYQQVLAQSSRVRLALSPYL